MSFNIPELHIPDDSPEALAIERVMKVKHVSAEEAVRSILRDAQPEPALPITTEDQTRWSKRAAERRRMGDIAAQTRPDTPELLFSFLSDAPEVAEEIRSLARERRANSYGI